MKFNGVSVLPWVVAPDIANVPLTGWRTEYPIMNNEKCCQCGTCYLYCPTGCIEDNQGLFVINLDFCKGCGICANECPNQSITMEKES